MSIYGLIIGFGVITFWFLFEAALRSALKTAQKTAASVSKASPASGVSQVRLTLALVLVSVFALVGARTYHLWTDWPLYRNLSWMDWVAVWNGGLGIYGALAGGLLGLVLWRLLLARRIPWLLLFDAVALGLPFGQAIGRWGNYVNKELFGLPTSFPWGIFIPQELRPTGYREFSFFHPLFLYESIAMLAIGGFFLLLWKRYRHLFPLGTGWYLGSYLFAYGSIRFSLELLRIQSAAGWFGLTIAQWISLALTAVGLVLFSRAFRLQWTQDVKKAPAHAPGSESRPASELQPESRSDHAERTENQPKRTSRADRSKRSSPSRRLAQLGHTTDTKTSDTRTRKRAAHTFRTTHTGAKSRRKHAKS